MDLILLYRYSADMKRIYLLSCTIILLFLLFTGCKRTQTTQTDTDASLHITASFYPLYIMLMNITDGIEEVQLDMLAPADTGCLHDYQLTTQDMKKIESASVLVLNGAGMEDFISKITEQKKDVIITAAEGYPLVDGNSHIWVSPKGAVYQVNRIAQGLARLDENHAQQYLENAAEYTAKINAFAEQMHTELDPYKGTAIITFHEAFPYFADEFDLQITGVIEREPGTAPSPKELTAIIAQIQKIRQNTGIPPVLFAEPGYASAAAEIIARETGLPVYELDPSVSGPLEKDAYLNAMKANMNVLKQAFSEQ